MDLDDLLGGERRHHGSRGDDHHDHRHRDDDHHRDHGDHHPYARETNRHEHHGDALDLSRLARLATSRPKTLIVGGLAALGIALAAAVLLLPLAGRLLGILQDLGVRGVLERLWLGSS